MKIYMFLLLTLGFMASAVAQNTSLPEGARIIEKKFTSVDEIFAQYKGKVVYVDFWASWCGPCKKAMPAAKQLQKKMAGKDVVFLYLAFNDRPEPWMANIKALDISGDHIFLDQNLIRQFDARFKINFIPRYVIIDKNGAVVTDQAPRPYDPRTEDMLLKLL